MANYSMLYMLLRQMCCHLQSLSYIHHLKILKFSDLLFINNALFVYDFHANILPSVFHDFFTPVNRVHQYNTRLASKDSYYISKVMTNYGKFNIRFVGAKVWNSIQEDFKSKSRKQFKKLLTNHICNTYKDTWCTLLFQCPLLSICTYSVYLLCIFMCICIYIYIYIYIYISKYVTVCNSICIYDCIFMYVYVFIVYLFWFFPVLSNFKSNCQWHEPFDLSYLTRLA